MKNKINQDILNLNLLSTKNVKQLTKEEEISLAKLIETGRKKDSSLRDQIKAHDAKNKLIYSNIGIVVDIAKNYHSSLDMAELIQFGITGLEGAINTFDYRIAKFSTHANLWVAQAIKRGIENRERIIRIPNKKLDKVHLINKTINELFSKNGNEPSFSELVETLKGKLDEKEIKDLLVVSQTTKSLDDQVYDDSKELDFVNDETTIDPNEYTTKNSNFDSFFKLFKTLSSIDQKIFSLMYGLYDHKERSVSEISVELSISSDKIKRSINNTEAFLNKHHIKL